MNVKLTQVLLFPLVSELYKTAREMVNFNVPVTLETLRNYVIPGFAAQGHLDTEGVIAGLKEAGIPVPLVVNGLVAYLMDTNNTSEAAKLCKNVCTLFLTSLSIFYHYFHAHFMPLLLPQPQCKRISAKAHPFDV